MAGEANDDPVPLMGAGVVFACSASLEVDKTVWWYGPVPLEEPEVVLAPPAPVVVVVVVVAPDVPAAVAAVVVVVTDEEPVVVVVVCAPSAPAGAESAATRRTVSAPTPTAPRPQLGTLVSR